MPLGNKGEQFPRPYGKYELLGRIGEGGMAEVFRARLATIGGFEKIVVIKRILPHLVHDRQVVDMFFAEAKLSAQIQHKNVVQVFELGEIEEQGEIFLVMEYIAGTDLGRLLRTAGRLKLRVPPWFTLHIMTEVLEALTYTHELKDESGRLRNIVHRDVTPSNIFVSRLGETKLGDFGIAKDSARSDLTNTGQLKGKVAYLSPEQLWGDPIDGRADVFAVGIVLWECLTQHKLFGGRPDVQALRLIPQAPRVPPSKMLPDVPPELDEIVISALQPERASRCPSAQELQSRLLDVLPKLKRSIRSVDVQKTLEMLTGLADPSPELRALDPAEHGGVEHLFFADESEEELIDGRMNPPKPDESSKPTDPSVAMADTRIRIPVPPLYDPDALDEAETQDLTDTDVEKRVTSDPVVILDAVEADPSDDGQETLTEESASDWLIQGPLAGREDWRQADSDASPEPTEAPELERTKDGRSSFEADLARSSLRSKPGADLLEEARSAFRSEPTADLRGGQHEEGSEDLPAESRPEHEAGADFAAQLGSTFETESSVDLDAEARSSFREDRSAEPHVERRSDFRDEPTIFLGAERRPDPRASSNLNPSPTPTSRPGSRDLAPSSRPSSRDLNPLPAPSSRDSSSSPAPSSRDLNPSPTPSLRPGSRDLAPSSRPSSRDSSSSPAPISRDLNPSPTPSSRPGSRDLAPSSRPGSRDLAPSSRADLRSERGASAAPSYSGAHPLWIGDSSGREVGPIGPLELVARLRASRDRRADRGLRISADRTEWIGTVDFVRLFGADGTLLAEQPRLPTKSEISGMLQQRSVLSVLAEISRNRLNGRLMIAAPGTVKVAYREIQVVDGAPTNVVANEESLELHEVLIQKKIIQVQSLEELIHRIVRFRMPLEEIIAAGVVDGSKFRVIALKERMLDILRWPAGGFAFEMMDPPVHPPFARSLESLLSELLHRSTTTDELRAALAPAMETRFEAAEGLDRALNELSFTPMQRELASKLAKGKKLSSLIRSTDEDRLQLIAARILIETSVLTPA